MMSLFRCRRRRKIHHGLIFDRQSPNKALSFEERMAVFATTQNSGPEISKAASGDIVKNEMSKSKEVSANEFWPRDTLDGKLTENNVARKQQAIWDKKELRWKKKRTPAEIADRRRQVIETLNRRRNAVCSEIERAWFLEGAHLEKHRHNLQVTHDLTVRGLAVWW